MASLNYQVGTAEVSTFTDIPAGDYAMLFTESEVKDTADRTGQFIVLKGTIIEGQYINRVFFERLNLWNKNEVAVRIAQGTLESICRSTGIQGVVSDSVQLHNKPFIAHITYKEREKQKGVMVELDEGRRNSISGYKPYVGAGTYTPPESTVVAAYTPPPAQAAGEAAVGEGAAPWNK